MPTTALYTATRIAYEARNPHFGEMDSHALGMMVEEAAAAQDGLAARIRLLGDELDEAMGLGEWRRTDQLRLEIISLDEQLDQVREDVRRLRDAYQMRVLDERVAGRLGGRRRALALEYLILGLTLVVLAMLAVERLFPLSEAQMYLLEAIDTGICGVFLADFLWRMRHAESKTWYLERHWLDLLGSLPLGGVARVGRVERVARGLRAWLRLVRIARLARALRSLHAVPFLSRGVDHFVALSKLPVFRRAVVLAVVLLLAGAWAVARYEGANAPAVQGASQSVWWSFTTVVTGGFADLYNPQSLAARLVTALLVVVGIVLTGVLTAGLAKVLVGEQTDRIGRQLAQIEEQIAQIVQRTVEPP